MRAEQERARLLISRAERWRKDGLVGEAQLREISVRFAQPWRTHGVVVQVVFFVLTVWALGAFYGLAHVLDVPKPGLVTGAVAIAVAELLIRRYRWFGTGVEAALWLGGAFALISALPRSGTPESLLVIAGGAAIAAMRVRNPAFGVVAAAIVVFYCESRFDAGVVSAVLLGSVGTAALLRTWRSPSVELFWSGMAVVIPLVGRFTADARWWAVTIALYAVFGTVALLLALLRRDHALFLAAGVGLVVASVDAGERIALPPEAKLAAAGALLLGLAWVVSRALAGRTSGIVASPARLTGFDEAVEIAGALAAEHATRPEAPTTDGRPQGDGGFGGAGATGEF